nr:immunoglobulin heavy chain junction region [Mus musculus]
CARSLYTLGAWFAYW